MIDGAVEALKELRKRDVKIFFATNNSSQTELAYVNKLVRMGITAKVDEILTSGRATAKYCQSVGARRIFVVGEPGLVDTLVGEGLGVSTSIVFASTPSKARSMPSLLASVAMRSPTSF